MEKKTIIAENGVPPVGPYSSGIKIGHWLFISGQGPLDPTTKKIPDEFKDQVRIVLENIRSLI
ncbi:MAG: RidA family protein, partial [Candidatus Helarchaeota archaeon]